MQNRGMASCALALALITSSANAAVIYRETFGNATNGSRQIPTVYSWVTHTAAGAVDNVSGSGHGIDTGATNGRPTDVANVNAGPNSDGSFGALPGSRYFWNGNRRLAWTPEFVVKPADYDPGSIVFSFYLGDANATDSVRLAIRTTDPNTNANSWYFSNSTFSSAVVASADYATAAEFKQLTYNPAAANWQVLTFDGTYDGGGYPGGPAANFTASSAALSSPGAATSDLSGNITGFGILYLNSTGNFATNPAGNIRFDTFQIDASPVPEPMSMTFAAAALALIGRTRQTRRRHS